MLRRSFLNAVGLTAAMYGTFRALATTPKAETPLAVPGPSAVPEESSIEEVVGQLETPFAVPEGSSIKGVEGQLQNIYARARANDDPVYRQQTLNLLVQFQRKSGTYDHIHPVDYVPNPDNKDRYLGVLKFDRGTVTVTIDITREYDRMTYIWKAPDDLIGKGKKYRVAVTPEAFEKLTLDELAAEIGEENKIAYYLSHGARAFANSKEEESMRPEMIKLLSNLRARFETFVEMVDIYKKFQKKSGLSVQYMQAKLHALQNNMLSADELLNTQGEKLQSYEVNPLSRELLSIFRCFWYYEKAMREYNDGILKATPTPGIEVRPYTAPNQYLRSLRNI